MLGRLLSTAFGQIFRKDSPAAADCVAAAKRALAHGELKVALAASEEALTLSPNYPPACHVRGLALTMLGQFDEALTSMRLALRGDGKNAELRRNYGDTLRLAGQTDSAEIEYRRVLALDPQNGHGHKALGSLLLELKRPTEAAASYRSALQIDPADREAQRGLGKALFRTRYFAEARDLFAALHEAAPLDIEDRYFLGTALLQTGKTEAAGDVLQQAYALAPDETALGLMLAFKHFFAGDWKEGFRLNEQRHVAMRTNPELPGSKPWIEFIDRAMADTPRWTEGGCAGKHLLLWSEQGMGDVIMMLRLLSALRETWGATTITLLCLPPVHALEACCEGVRFIVANTAWKARPGEFDLHCSVMSLPYLMGITLDSIPGHVPFLRVPKAEQALWREKLAALPGLKVGLAWAGSPVLSLDCLRSIALEQLKPLFACRGVSFVCLQKDDAAREEARASGLPMADWMDQVGNFMDTAALMDGLDLIISVDTAVVHLAGALGKPVWLLNRFESEWRWMRDREDSPWYPSLRLFNQTETRNWGPIIEKVTTELMAVAKPN